MLSRRTAIFLGASTLLGSLPKATQAQTVMRVSTLLEEDPATLIAERVMREAYLRLGIALEVEAMSGERSLISANSGETDGELYRKIDVDKVYTNLVRIPVALQTYEVVVFTKGESFKVEGWDSLRPYKIGFVKGIKIIEEKTIGLHAESVATMHQAFTKLDRGRTDLVIANRITGLASVRAHQFHGVKVLLPPLASFPVFHYVNRKHEALVPRLTQTLKGMEQDRTLKRIKEDVLANF